MGEIQTIGCLALIPAAGRGSRFGGDLPKQYLTLHGKTVLEHTILRLAAVSWVDEIRVILAPDDAYGECLLQNLQTAWQEGDYLPSRQHALPKVLAYRVGGTSRAASVRNGLLSAAPRLSPASWVLVHDAARPCLGLAELQRLEKTLLQTQDPVGGLLAVPMADTVKRANLQQQVIATEPREMLWQAQTPQMFRFAILQKALMGLSEEELAGVTDEAQAVEHLGLLPHLVLGSNWNRKVTVAEDLWLAEQILVKF